MKNIEDVMADKIYELVNLILSKVIKPDISIEKVCELDDKMIDWLKTDYGIEGIILDVDETLRKNMKKIPKCNQEWIEKLKGKLKVIIVSNGLDKNIEQFFSERAIDYIGFAHKPLKRGFIEACERMNIEPSKVLVIGYSVLDDIYGGRRNKMKTVLVKKVEDDGR